MDRKLVEINQNDLPLLKSLYDPNQAETYTGYATVDTYMRWFQRHPNNDGIKFYSLNGDFSHGTYVVVDDYTHLAYADTLNENTEELFNLLLLIDQSKGYLWNELNEGPMLALKEALKRKNIEIIYENPGVVYFLPKGKALQFDIQPPDGIELRPLNESDAQKAFLAWPHSARSCPQLFECAAETNPSIGAFKRDGTLVAWVLRWPGGLLLALHTDKEYFGRGYGTLVTKAIAKRIAEMGYDVYTSTLPTNKAAQRLFAKVGFEKLLLQKYWLCTKLNWDAANEK